MLTIHFAPRRGAILMCDFGPEGGIAPHAVTQGPLSVPPEITKLRRCVVVSPEAMNARQGGGRPGLCVVVPVSATPPSAGDVTAIPLSRSQYRSLTLDAWAKCSLVTSVSHDRLARPQRKGHNISEWLTRADMVLVDNALRAALGL